MTELKPCPLCGGKVSLERKMDGAYSFDCQRCGLDARLPECLDETNKGTAIEAWNTRYEPTCTMDANEYGDISCSNCGTEMSFYDLGCGLGESYYDHPFCFQCGAKVIGGAHDE